MKLGKVDCKSTSNPTNIEEHEEHDCKNEDREEHAQEDWCDSTSTTEYKYKNFVVGTFFVQYEYLLNFK